MTQGPGRRPLVQRTVNTQTSEEIQQENDADVIEFREENCRPWDMRYSLGPRPRDPAAEDRFPQAVREGRWDEARWYLYRGVTKPGDMTATEERQLRREELSLALFEPARLGDVAEVRRLLRLGADPNTWIELDDVATPLAWASACNRVDVVRALLDGGANPNQRFWWGHGPSYKDSTPLFFAARFGSTETARLLVKRGADVNAVSIGTDRWDETRHWRSQPLDWAETREMKAFLRSKGAKETSHPGTDVEN